MSADTPAFGAEVGAWADEAKERLLAVYKASAQELVEVMLTTRPAGGNMPIDTGFLRQSLVASTSAMPSTNPNAVPRPGGSYGANPAVNAVIATLGFGDTLFLGFVAAYAMRQNYGFTGTDRLGRHYSQRGHLFVEKAVQRWPEIVAAMQAQLSEG